MGAEVSAKIVLHTWEKSYGAERVRAWHPLQCTMFEIASIKYSVHYGSMRTSINLDADAYEFASYYAHAKGITLGAAVSELVRRAENAPEPSSSRLRMNEHGLLVKAKTGKVITPEMVKESSEDDIE